MGALSLLIFLPLIALAGILILPNRLGQSFKYISMVVTLVQFGLAGYLYANYNGIAGNLNEVSSYQYVEQLPWIRLD
jgi:NADH-quinone oxidoreductase subunit M